MRNIRATGTVRINRTCDCPIDPKNLWNKKEKGTIQSATSLSSGLCDCLERQQSCDCAFKHPWCEAAKAGEQKNQRKNTASKNAKCH